jgi:hypothetical protein
MPSILGTALRHRDEMLEGLRRLTLSRAQIIERRLSKTVSVDPRANLADMNTKSREPIPV